MHPNRAFQDHSTEHNISFARSRAFGTLATNGDEGPLTAHVPFLLEPGGKTAELHLVRSNPIARLALPVPCVITIMGPDSYISPDWYEVADQVPTWNYIAVRLRGHLHALPQEDLHALLNRLSEHFEQRLSPKRIWTSDKMSDGVMDRMMRMISPFRMDVTKIEGTWKLGQNKPDHARLSAAENVKAGGIGTDLADLAGMMTRLPEG